VIARGLQQPVTRHDDPVVGGHEVLARAVLDASRALLDRSVLQADAVDAAEAAALLLRAAKDLAARGTPPPALDPAHQRVRSASIVLPGNVAFKEGAREALVAHPDKAPVSI
jgi:hypothetical protein